MNVSVCKNPKCGKEFKTPKNEVTDGFCSFECWEDVNCKEPLPVETEEFIID